ncbi:MAG: hypothetical protein KGY45_01745 [Hadesarchaea archaeon]|nr:hypothetical protein [Hadesarchaea archaeon]
MSEDSDDISKLDELVKEESKKPKGTLHCPKCGSHRLVYFIGFKAGQIFYCKNCEYQGPLAVEDGEMASQIKEKWIEEKED